MAKEKNKRQKEQYPALKPELNLKTRYELIDQDYIHKLSDQDKVWLNQFMEEYTNASFKQKKALNKTKKQKKDCYDRNNARNRCILTKAKASNNYTYFEDLKGSKHEKIEEYENELISSIDGKKRES